MTRRLRRAAAAVSVPRDVQHDDQGGRGNPNDAPECQRPVLSRKAIAPCGDAPDERPHDPRRHQQRHKQCWFSPRRAVLAKWLERSTVYRFTTQIKPRSLRSIMLDLSGSLAET